MPARSKVLDYRLHGDRSVKATLINSEMFLPPVILVVKGAIFTGKGSEVMARKGNDSMTGNGSCRTLTVVTSIVLSSIVLSSNG